MDKNIFDLLLELREDDAVYPEDASVFIEKPVKLYSLARITIIDTPSGGWSESDDGGVKDGKTFFSTVSYIKSFAYYDWTVEDMFNELRYRCCGIEF